MALVKFGAIVTDATGKVGGVCYQGGVGSARVRNETRTRTPVTTATNKIRSNFAYLSNYWKNVLSDTQRESWRNFAREHSINNENYGRIFLTGKASFIRQNKLVVWAEQAIIADAPEFVPFDPSIRIDTTAFVVAPVRMWFIMAPWPLPAGYYTFGHVSGPRGPGILRDYRRGLYLIETKTHVDRAWLDFGNEWVTKYGDPVSGGRFFYKICVLNAVTGQFKVFRLSVGIFS